MPATPDGGRVVVVERGGLDGSGGDDGRYWALARDDRQGQIGAAVQLRVIIYSALLDLDPFWNR